MNGISTITSNNKLFFCGIESELFINGSYFFSFDMESKGEPKLLINSIYPHYEPSIVKIDDDTLAVIGGKGSKFCEFVNLKTMKWKSIPKLPSERYLGTLLFDKDSGMLYLFGGNNEESIQKETVFKLNMNMRIKWEVLFPRRPEVLMRNKALIVRTQDDLLIVGGETYGDKSKRVDRIELETLETFEFEHQLLDGMNVTDAVFNFTKDKLFFFDEVGTVFCLNPLSMNYVEVDFY